MLREGVEASDLWEEGWIQVLGGLAPSSLSFFSVCLSVSVSVSVSLCLSLSLSL
jgi:hypothetical protein